MKSLRILVLLACSVALLAGVAQATPSTTYWTPMTLDIQGYLVPHIGVDNYFTVGKSARTGSGDFPTDVGLTMGILPFEKLQMEVGIDYLAPTDDPLFFNAKIGTPEGSLFEGSPTLQAGIFNVGTKHNVTDQNIVFGVVGKTIPGIGRLSAGPYYGNNKVLVNKRGNADNKGFMVAFDRGFFPVKDKDGKDEFNRVVLAADYASGKNALGGGGVGAYYFFTKDISLLTGPVWFNEKEINGKWKWTVQLDINLPAVNTWFK